MSEFFTFSEHHWWIATFMLALVVHGICDAFQRLMRIYRVINITARGWPPAHLDADGDWKPEKKEEVKQ